MAVNLPTDKGTAIDRQNFTWKRRSLPGDVAQMVGADRVEPGGDRVAAKMNLDVTLSNTRDVPVGSGQT